MKALKKTIKNDNRGITLLIAVLSSSIILSISLSIFNIALKELLISGAGRDSHIALYAADGGIECALYWDYRGAFSTTTGSTISCSGATYDVGGGTLSNFTLWDSITRSCSNVTVNKSGLETIIESRGYNTCDPTPRRTERGIRVRY